MHSLFCGDLGHTRYGPANTRSLCEAGEDLHNFLKEKLPEYMIPAAFVTIDALPLTPNGKVDRRGLPEPEPTRPNLGVPIVSPRTPIEEQLAGLWSQIIGVDHVGVHDNFFDLGGHSLLATQVMSRISNLFQLEIPLRSLFETPTIAGLAAVIKQAKDSGVEVQPPVIVPLSRQSHRVSMSPTGTLEVSD